MTEIQITNHASDRMKERLGLPIKAHQRQAERAYECGLKRADISGKAHRYLDSLTIETGSDVRVFANAVYIFKRQVLITVYHIPCNIRRWFK